MVNTDSWVISRLYARADGESCFEDVTLSLEEAGELGRLSSGVDVSRILFRENDGDYNWDFHNAPARQYIIMLGGVTEIEASSGEKRLFRAGDVLLVEDTHGKGHRSRSVDGTMRRSIFVTLP